MKRLAFTLGLVIALAFPALAQQYTVGTLTLSTNACLQNATEAGDSSAITLTRYEDVGLQGTFTGTADSTNVATFTFKASPDATTYGNTATQFFSFGVTNTGATAHTFVTNITVGPIGYLKLDSVAHADDAGTGITGLSIKYSLKPKRYGS